MEGTVHELADLILAKLATNKNDTRIVVGICGVPASGKTSLALNVVDRVNSAFRSTSESESDADVAICVSQDGWHLPRAALDKFDDVKHAYDRRGAAFTFDGVAFSQFVLSLRDSSHEVEIEIDHPTSASASAADGELRFTPTSDTLYAPGFSHTLKDPTENAHAIHPHHKVIVIEGLYTFLGIEPWKDASLALDERWFIDVDPAVARDRLVRRHVVTGVAKDLEEAEWRADNNDIPNGEFIRLNMLEPTRTITSVDDPIMALHGRTE